MIPIHERKHNPLQLCCERIEFAVTACLVPPFNRDSLYRFYMDMPNRWEGRIVDKDRSTPMFKRLEMVRLVLIGPLTAISVMKVIIFR